MGRRLSVLERAVSVVVGLIVLWIVLSATRTVVDLLVTSETGNRLGRSWIGLLVGVVALVLVRVWARRCGIALDTCWVAAVVTVSLLVGLAIKEGTKGRVAS